MVKGITKRVIVVRFPDTRVFEQAIFIVREDAAVRTGVSADQVVQEACRIAEGYTRKNPHLRRIRKLAVPIGAAAGAGLMGLIWLLTNIIH